MKENKNEVMTDKSRQLVLDNINLVYYVLKKRNADQNLKYTYSRDYDDLFQAGCYGLCIAANRFDESKGIAFSTYAIPYINGLISKFIRDCDGRIKYKRSNDKLLNKFRGIAKDNGLNFSDVDNLSILRDILTDPKDLEDLEELQKNLLYNNVASLNNLVPHQKNHDEDKSFIDIIEFIDDKFDYVEYMDLVTNMIEFCTNRYRSQRNKEVFQEYMYDLIYSGIKHKQTKLASKYDITQAHLSRILKEGFRYCREYLIESGIYFEKENKTDG